jgi:tetratricopeptide (TPR) repeat protein/transcriptional regulator with XRE-family HTH domain
MDGGSSGGSSPTFGELTRRYRTAAGLTQEDLAERAGVSARSIGDIERGVSQRPHKDTVGLLAAALGLTGAARTKFEATARRRAPPTPRPPAGDSLPATRDAPLFLHPAAPPLVGRSRELGLLERHLTGVGPPILLLAGEPGLGKTRLVAEATRRAARRGWSVLEGGCRRRDGQEPFAPLAAALTAFLAGRTPGELRDDLRGCAWLVRLLPELAGTIGDALPSWALPPDQERRLMFAAVARLLANVAQRGGLPASGVLLALDDLQWAGSDALELLTALVRSRAPLSPSAERPPLRVVGAYRDTEVQPHDCLGVALADWAHAGLVTHLALPRLTPEDCGHLLDTLLAGPEADETDSGRPAALRERVLQRAGGVPFFVVSYAQALRRGDIGAGAEGVPWDAAQSVRQRVGALPEPAQALLTAAAVVGRVARPALLMAVVARPEEEVLAGLDAACQARLLLDAGGDYHFAHDVVREVVEADTGSARRAALHRRAAAALEALHADRLPDHYETLAHHYMRGGAWEEALRYLALSGAKASGAGALHEALQAYDQALAVCARLGPPAMATTAGVAEKRAFVGFDSGDFAGAAADFARMRAAAAQARDRPREGRALAYGGMAAYYGHDFEAAEALLREALAVAREGFDDVRLFASIQLSSLLMVTGRHREAAPLLETVEVLAPRVDDPFSRSWWAITGSEVLHWSGRYNDALALLERWQGAVTSGNQLLELLWTKWEAALARGGKGDYAPALTLLDEVVTTCAGSGESFIRARALNTAGWIHGELQDHARAMELNGRSLDLARAIETADPEIESNARLNLGDSLLALGRLAEAEAHFRAVERVVRDPRPQDRWMLWRYAQHLFHSYGTLWLARGDAATALAYADECLRGAEASDSPKNIVKARRLRGEIALARGELAAAEAELRHALRVARRIGNPPQLWKTFVALGDLWSAQGSSAAARRAYGDALTVVRRVAADLPATPLRETFLASPHVRAIMSAHREADSG